MWMVAEVVKGRDAENFSICATALDFSQRPFQNPMAIGKDCIEQFFPSLFSSLAKGSDRRGCRVRSCTFIKRIGKGVLTIPSPPRFLCGSGRHHPPSPFIFSSLHICSRRISVITSLVFMLNFEYDSFKESTEGVLS